MREIKFRGKRIDNGEWVYGDIELPRNREAAIIHCYLDDGNYNRKYEVQKESVGQFTGLYDKNGKEIYEGDVVKAESLWFEKECTMIVSWKEDTGRWFMYYTKNHGYLYPQDLEEIEVVGNIHEKQNDEQ